MKTSTYYNAYRKAEQERERLRKRETALELIHLAEFATYEEYSAINDQLDRDWETIY